MCLRFSKATIEDKKGAPIIVLSDKSAGPDRMPIPSLIALGAVHTLLLRTRQRAKAAVFLESGDACEVHTISPFYLDMVPMPSVHTLLTRH